MISEIEPKKITSYLAPPLHLKELMHELVGSKIILKQNDICVIEGEVNEAFWIQNKLNNCHFLEFSSINEAARKLKEIHPTWFAYSFNFHRRTSLISEKMRSPKLKKIKFLADIPQTNIGHWFLVTENKLIYSLNSNHPLLGGVVEFEQNKTEPPSRAYLKLWELFTLYLNPPEPNSLCLDMGSAPGGWTWVLGKLGAKVISVDKADLAPSVLELKNVEQLKGSAFSIRPEEIGPLNWFFSDIICYPEKLQKLIEKWMNTNLCENFVCTIKFQGETDFNVINNLRKVEGSGLVHLYHNRHELTWFRVNPKYLRLAGQKLLGHKH